MLSFSIVLVTFLLLWQRHDQKGRERFIWLSYLGSQSIEESQRRDLEAGTEAEGVEECYLLSSSAWLAQLAFLSDTRPLLWCGTAPSVLGPPIWGVSQENGSPSCPHASLMKALSQLKLPLTTDCGLCQVDKNKTNNNNKTTRSAQLPSLGILIPVSNCFVLNLEFPLWPTFLLLIEHCETQLFLKSCDIILCIVIICHILGVWGQSETVLPFGTDTNRWGNNCLAGLVFKDEWLFIYKMSAL